MTLRRFPMNKEMNVLCLTLEDMADSIEKHPV